MEALHAAPEPGCGTQVLFSQLKPGTHWLEEMQSVKQDVAVAQTKLPGQGLAAVSASQAPVPSQDGPGVNQPPSHAPEPPQAAPASAYSQAPVPGAQAVAPQIPASPQDMAQQKPPRQSRPIWQSGALPPSPQGAPALAGDRQEPAKHWVPLAQSLLVAQDCWQAVPPSLQAKLLEHWAEAPGTQVSAPPAAATQVPPCVNLLPLQTAGLHGVPATVQVNVPLVLPELLELDDWLVEVLLLFVDELPVPPERTQMPVTHTWPGGQLLLGPQRTVSGGTDCGRQPSRERATTSVATAAGTPPQRRMSRLDHKSASHTSDRARMRGDASGPRTHPHEFWTRPPARRRWTARGDYQMIRPVVAQTAATPLAAQAE